MRRTDHQLHPKHSGLRPRGVRAVGTRLAVTLVVGLATFAATALPALSASAAASTSVRSTPFQALLAKLKDPAATAGDSFGFSVAVSGTTAGVGASGAYTERNSDAGEAYIYVKGTSGWPTKPTATLDDPAATVGDDFGWSVAVSETTAVVGAPGNAGTAYIYVKGTSGWPTKPTVTLDDPAAPVGDDMFGSWVALSGKTAVVGAPGTNKGAGVVYIYVKGSSGWTKTPTIELSDPAATRADAFGTSVALSGKTAVVGAWGTNSYRGAAYIYVKGSSGWPTTPTTTLTDPKASADDEFGLSVAVQGTSAVVGAQGTSPGGAAYIYVKSPSGWPKTPTIKLADPAAKAYDLFGGSVALSGKTAVVGAADGGELRSGAAYLYVKGKSSWPTTPTTTLTDPEAKPDSFGYSVAVSGTTAVVGAPGTRSSAGATYVYKD